MEQQTAIRCPACGGPRLRKVYPSGLGNLLCDGCGACWRPGVGGLSRVDPIRCPGCSSQRVCRAALAERSP